MSKKDMFYKELIQLDLDAKDQEDFFDQMTDKLYELGYVKDSFKEAIKVREENYPTALPIEGNPIAIPHADPQHIIKPFIACTRLKNPVKWHEMANNDVSHDVKVIFMLGFLGGHGDESGSNEHIELLQMLVKNFKNPELMDQILNAKTVDEFMEVVLSMEE